jgi:hypothetical protein
MTTHEDLTRSAMLDEFETIDALEAEVERQQRDLAQISLLVDYGLASPSGEHVGVLKSIKKILG